MSWDVNVYGDEYEEECCECGQVRKRHRVLFDGNYTYNVAPLYYMLLGDKGLSGLDGMTGIDAAEYITKGLVKHSELEAAGHDFAKYEPENGWGSVDGAIKFLRRIYTACVDAPAALVRVT